MSTEEENQVIPIFTEKSLTPQYNLEDCTNIKKLLW